MDEKERAIRLRFMQDFEFYAPRCLKLKAQEGGIIPFALTEQQKKLHAVAERQLRETGRVRIIVAKGRKTKTSTYVQGRFFWKVTHRKGVKAFVIAHERETADEIFSMADRFYRYSPPMLRPEATNNSAKELNFEEIDSGYSVGTAGNVNVGRGFTPHYLHLSEAAFFQKGEETARGIMTAVADAAGTEVWIESTGNGPGDWFHSQATAALEGKSGFELVFLEWWLEPQYSLDEDIVLDDEEQKLLQQCKGMTVQNLAWRRRQISKYGGSDSAKMLFRREFPCIDGNARVGTNRGVIPMKEVRRGDILHSGEVLDAWESGVKPCFKVTTADGYQVIATANHPFALSEGGFCQTADLLGKSIRISGVRLSDSQFTDVKSILPCQESSVAITPSFGRFLGYFMGDGSYHKDTLSIACAATDQDVVKDVIGLISDLFGKEAYTRLVGTKKGCSEVRVSSVEITRLLLQIGAIRNNCPGIKRKICVPEVIWRSPREVVRQFLIGIFESDGCAYKGQSAKVMLFSKYVDFLRDVQRLLLSFGVRSRVVGKDKVTDGHKFIGWELHATGERAQLFAKEIGFFSKRKRDISSDWFYKQRPRTLNTMDDVVVAVESVGDMPVFDMEVRDSHVFDANGLLVHNCSISDVFSASEDSFIPPDLVEAAAKREDAPDGPLVVGIDPGGGGKDPTVLVARKGGRQFYSHVLKEKEPDAVVGRLNVLLEELKPKAVFIDNIGVGYHLVGQLSAKHPGVRGVDFRKTAIDEAQFANRRAECYATMKAWLATGCIQDDPLLKLELSVFKYKFRAHGQLVLESKDDAKERGNNSPNCFVAGTLVETPGGARRIETLRVGDLVSTPFGHREVIKTWESETEEVTTVRLSDGREIECTPKHGIFCWGKGWVDAGRLCINNEIETFSEDGRKEWQRERSRFTWDKSFTFTRLAGISAVAEKKTRRDFCIAASGLTRTGQSQKSTTFITRTVTGETTPSRIWSALKRVRTVHLICENACKMLSSARRRILGLKERATRQGRGTELTTGSSGIPSTEGRHGRAESDSLQNAPFATAHTLLSFLIGRDSVRTSASSLKQGGDTPRAARPVAIAEASSFTRNTSSGRIAVAGVTSRREQARVYNVTLNDDNCYYANGILVKNCADALAITFAEPVENSQLDDTLWNIWPFKPRKAKPGSENLPDCNFITAYAWLSDEQWAIAAVGVFVPDTDRMKQADQKTELPNAIILKYVTGDGPYHFMDACHKLYKLYEPDYFYVPTRATILMKDLRIKNLTIRRAKFDTVGDVVAVATDVLKDRVGWVRNTSSGHQLIARLARYPHGTDEALYGCIGLALAHLKQRGDIAVQFEEPEEPPRRRRDRRTAY